MTSSMLRRQLKNLVQNYSEAEVKVREATSNDPWGPSSSQMADLSDLTYNVVACNEIMTMLWKRLKDDKNWRHIHKSLTLLEYLLKTGDDRVLLKMKDNIYIVKALTEYRFVEKDGKDQGANVREKAKVVLVLMEDDEKLKEERDFAVKTREKTSKSSAASSTDAIKDPNYRPVYVPGATGLPSLDNIPSVADLTASFAARKEERLKQEAEKKEVERRAKMTDDELKWEDAGKGGDLNKDAWGGDKPDEEEAKTDAWGAPVKPDTSETPPSSDPWGAPAKSEDPFAAPKTEKDQFSTEENGEDPFAAPKDKPDPFSASKDDPFNAPKESSDPLSAPKDKEDPFAAPKDKPDPFTSSDHDPFNAPKDDPFNAPKDDPFNAPKDDPFSAPKNDPFNTPKDDPFNTPKDDPFKTPKDDPFNAPKDDPFNTPKDDPFNAPKDDPFHTPKDDPFNAPKDDPFSAPKDDPFSTPKDDPCNTSKDDPFGTPKDDPFNTPKDDPFSTSRDDPFNAPVSTPPKEEPFAASKEDPFTASVSSPTEDPFSATAKPTQDDPFMSATTPPEEDPFSTPSNTTKDDPFMAPTTPPKEDPFIVQPGPPKDDASDPFSAPPVSSPQGSADAWEAPATSPPATGSDPWGAPSAPNETMGGDPWGDGKSSFSPVDPSDAFGDTSKPDSDPWGAPASAPVNTDDAWGSPAPPSASSPSSDPFGDGSKKDDPWGALSNAPSNGTGKRTIQEKEIHRKTASFLDFEGASLVDLDDLLSSNTVPKQRTLANTFAVQTQAIGTLNASGPTSVQLVRPGAVSGVTYCSPFESTLVSSVGEAADLSGKKPTFPLPSHTAREACCGSYMPLIAPLCPGNRFFQSVSVEGRLHVGLNVKPHYGGVEMVLSGPMAGNPTAGAPLVETALGQTSYFGGNQQAGVVDLGGFISQSGDEVLLQPQIHSGRVLGETSNTNNNPFLF